MKLIINDNREIEEKNLFVGYLEENKATVLEFQIPDYLQGYAKKACFRTEDGETFAKLFDNVSDNTLTLTADILSYDKLDCTIQFMNNDEVVYKTSLLHLIILDAVICDDDVQPDDPKVIILDELITRVSGLIEEVDNIDIDAEKEGNIATVTVTRKDGEVKSVQVKDGIDGIGLDYDWDNTALGIKREDEAEYQYVELKGEKGDCNFATFDIEDGDLIMNKDEDMNIDFEINQGRLEVIING